MQLIIHPQKGEWPQLLKRPYVSNGPVLARGQEIIDAVKEEGDAALKKYTEQLDGVALENFEVSQSEIEEAAKNISEDLKQSIQVAKNNIEHFHATQIREEEVVETMPGVRCWRKAVGIQKVGLYIPGGTAPLFSTILMLAIPARIAGCEEIIFCTPSSKNGSIHPAILYTAQLTGIKKIYKLGGAQAIAAMAYGTETIDAVYKIFGPGNQYVTAAKQLVQMDGIAIDMPAGPSEVCVLADETAEPDFVAADLLSQAEHGKDSQVLLVSTSEELVKKCLASLQHQLALLPRKELAEAALENSKAIVVDNIDEAMQLVNYYSAEHLIICCENAEELAKKVVNAGSVFIGNYSPESVGDYASGTNHTLPTNAFARAYSGVSVDSFTKKITMQQLTKEGLQNIGKTVVTMAEAEGLDAHAAAVSVRLKTMEQ